MLQVDELTVPGLIPVSFEVGNGDCVTVAGPSGSGKTLLPGLPPIWTPPPAL